MLGTRLGVFIAALLAVAAATFGAVAPVAPVAAADGIQPVPYFRNSAQQADWRQFRGDADHRGWNSYETTISVSNVSQLRILWRAAGGFNSSPAVANGVVYDGDGGMAAYDVNCRTDGGNCAALWKGNTGYPDWDSPAVGGGMVYMQSVNGLFAFKVGCRNDGGTCAPIWTGTNADAGYTSPTLANGWLFVATGHGQLQAYNVTRCASTGGVCAPDWVATTNGESHSSPSVAKGIVYIVDALGYLTTYPVHCASTGATCAPLGRTNLGTSGDAHVNGSVAVADGVAYVSTYEANAFAFATSCLAASSSCTPLWAAKMRGKTHSSPAVSDTTVYFVSGRRIYAYAIGCRDDGGRCQPLWRSGRHPVGGGYASSPAIANGLLFIAQQGKYQANGKLLAFDANCAIDGRTCTALWRSPSLGGMTNSSPAVAHGQVFVATNGGTFYAFGLPSAP
jgi:hypothetical protein